MGVTERGLYRYQCDACPQHVDVGVDHSNPGRALQVTEADWPKLSSWSWVAVEEAVRFPQTHPHFHAWWRLACSVHCAQELINPPRATTDAGSATLGAIALALALSILPFAPALVLIATVCVLAGVGLRAVYRSQRGSRNTVHGNAHGRALSAPSQRPKDTSVRPGRGRPYRRSTRPSAPGTYPSAHFTVYPPMFDQDEGSERFPRALPR